MNDDNHSTENETSMNPKVSVVVPVYNAEEYIEETLQSLVKQTYQNLKIIAIDDGSKDKSFEIMKRFSPRVEIFSRVNRGQSATLNEGWALALSGVSADEEHWLSYLGADDLLAPNAISSMVEFSRRNREIGVIYPNYHLIDAKGKILKRIDAPEFDEHALFALGVCQPGPGAIFKKEVFYDIGGWSAEYRQVPDWEFWLRVATRFSFKKFPMDLAAFRVHESSQTFQAPPFSKAEEPVQALSGLIEKLNNGSLSSVSFLSWREEALANAHLLSARMHLKAFRLRDAWSHVRAASTHDFSQVCKWISIRHLLGGLLGQTYYRIRGRIAKS